MRVISFSMIRDFIAKHADADVALRDWYKRTTKANWTNFADIKQTFNIVDYVREGGTGIMNPSYCGNDTKPFVIVTTEFFSR